MHDTKNALNIKLNVLLTTLVSAFLTFVQCMGSLTLVSQAFMPPVHSTVQFPLTTIIFNGLVMFVTSAMRNNFLQQEI